VSLHHDQRDRLAKCDPWDFDALVDTIAERFEGLTPEEKQRQLDTVPVWYHRHQHTPAQIEAAAAKARLLQEEREAAQANPDESVDDGLCGACGMFDA
jgi:hypothetical protein